MLLDHTKACLRAAASRERARARWRARWPDHCRRCEANTDSGRPCESCLLDNFKCPRCGLRGVLHEERAEVPCMNCGWAEGIGMGCPEPYKCGCRVAVEAARGEERGRLERERDGIDRRLRELR